MLGQVWSCTTSADSSTRSSGNHTHSSDSASLGTCRSCMRMPATVISSSSSKVWVGRTNPDGPTWNRGPMPAFMPSASSPVKARLYMGMARAFMMGAISTFSWLYSSISEAWA